MKPAVIEQHRLFLPGLLYAFVVFSVGNVPEGVCYLMKGDSSEQLKLKGSKDGFSWVCFRREREGGGREREEEGGGRNGVGISLL